MIKIFINICEESLGVNTPKTYLKAYEDLYKSEWIETYIYYIWNIQSNENYGFIKAYKCVDKEDLSEKIKNVYKSHEVVFINTFTEGLIQLVNDLKQECGETITEQHLSFRDKSLQRKYLQQHNSELWIKYIYSDPKNIDINNIEKSLEYPFVIKPSSGLQSAWVAIIDDREKFYSYMWEYSTFLEKFTQRGFENETLIFEEFIDGEMYASDYYVNQDGDITLSPPTHVSIGSDIGIDDFMNYVRSYRENTINNIPHKQIKEFIQETVLALWIKNTYIHHEYKYTSKWKLKTIEVNGRIGWYRLEMIQEALNFNWLGACIWKKIPENLEYNFSSFLVYPEKKCTLVWFNNELFQKIENLPSIYFVNKIEKFIWEEIWLTSQWFTKVAIIKIKNSNNTQFEEDYLFIEKNYKELLIVK